MKFNDIAHLLGEEASNLLDHQTQTISKQQVRAPSGDHVQQVFADSDRSAQVQKNLNRLYQHGRLKNTGYLSILPVDQGVEHTAAHSFVYNPIYFDPENKVKLAIEGGCNAVASTLGILGLVSKKYADEIPFIVKLNHNELLTHPVKHDQHMFAQVEQAQKWGLSE